MRFVVLLADAAHVGPPLDVLPPDKVAGLPELLQGCFVEELVALSIVQALPLPLVAEYEPTKQCTTNADQGKQTFQFPMA